MTRSYLDWNATTPLRREARAAMLGAMDVPGNPSSVHAEGRKAKALVEKARAQVAGLVGCEPSEIVFTAGATEAAHLVLRGTAWMDVAAADTEHSCITQNIRIDEVEQDDGDFKPETTHVVINLDEFGRPLLGSPNHDLFSVAAANSETGVLNDLGRFCDHINGDLMSDITQAVGKIELPAELFDALPGRGARFMIGAAHKFGGPKGVGFAVFRGNTDQRVVQGGGQEMGRRSGTENVIGIAGLGAAAEAASRDLKNGVWQDVQVLRDLLEDRLTTEAPETLVIGRGQPRLPNTSYFAMPGWQSGTQVMQMDLAGFAVSAGSACSSGKVKTSKVLTALGYDAATASGAIRVSIGPDTTKDEIMRFADTWLAQQKKFAARAA